MSQLTGKSRPIVDLAVAFGVGLALLLLNLVLNFNDRLHAFVSASAGFLAMDWIIHLLLGWMAVLLALAFVRWREASRRSYELENVISSISPDALLLVDPQRRIFMCNASVQRLFGYQPDELIGVTTDRLYSDRRTDKSRPHEIFDALASSGFHVGIAQGQHHDGHSFPLEIISAELSGRAGAVLLLRDITARVEAERQRHELEEQMRRREKLHSLGVMAGGVAHDFSNLLTVIMGNTELARLRAPQDERLRESLDSVLAAARQAADLCNQMLAYSGHAKTVFCSLSLVDCVQDTLQVLQSSVRPVTRVESDFAHDTPNVEVDPVQIRQVVMNLVLNASEAMLPNGDGVIRVRTGRRTFSAEELAANRADTLPPPGSYAFVQVSDNGSGMDEETLAKLFDPFFSTKRTGRGLGLASVLGIVRGHAGALTVTSRKGEGAAFTIVLPCTRPPAAAANAAPGPSQA